MTFVLASQFLYSQNSSLTVNKSKLYRLDRIKDKTIIQEIEPLLVMYSENTMQQNLTSIPLIDTNEFYSNFRGQGLEILINCEYFYPPLHSINYDPNLKKHNVKGIDGQVFWGTNGDIPKTKVHKIKVISNGVNIQVPDTAIAGMFNPNFGCNKIDCYNFVYLSNDKKRIYIVMNNSDGAGFYIVVWIFKDNKYYDRVIDLGP